jgi:hypothetical protein
MPFRYIWARQNANLEFQMNKVIAFDIGVDHKSPKSLMNGYYYITGSKYHFGSTISFPATEKFSIQVQLKFLQGIIEDHTKYTILSNNPNYLYDIRDTSVTFNTIGYSAGIGFEIRPVAGLFLKLNFCYQNLPYQQKFNEIFYIDEFSEKRPTSTSWKFPLTLGGIADLQFSVGYRFGLKKK